MTSYGSPTDTFPLVFESGVVNICEDGTVEVHLSHSKDEPHPMKTHPDGEDTTIPKRESEVDLVGTDRETVKVQGGIAETDTLPTGFVFRIKGWRLIQLEMSGDLTIVMAEMEDVPDWFQPGKIHRFDGPEGGVSLYTGSQPFVTKNTRTRPTLPKSEPVSKLKDETPKSQNNTTTQSKSGCGLMVLLFTLVGIGMSSVSFWM